MEAIRHITQLDDDILSLKLPESFKAQRVEVIVMLAAENDMPEQTKTPRRSPSRKLEGTRIIGDIMSPVVSENDWDALQ
jgi:hypothetical protein